MKKITGSCGLLFFLLALGGVSEPASAGDTRAERPWRPDPESIPVTPAPTLHVVTDPAVYRAECRDNDAARMVDLAPRVPGLVIDLRYATGNNFLGRPLYPEARALARAATADALREVEAALRPEGLGLKVFDAYRPYSATVRMWVMCPESHAFLAPPELGSDHNRGTAVDVSLVDLKTGKELAMPTDFDTFGPKASLSYSGLPAPVFANRQKLRQAMETHGFRGFDVEWWHYSLRGGKSFSLLDLPFSAFPPMAAH